MKNMFKKVIGLLTLLYSFYLFLYLKYNNTTFILVYHQIDNYKGGLKSLYVKPEVFEKQMKTLYLKGYKSITLDELKYRIENKLPLKKVFCITFDDGYKNLENAYSILKKYGFKATVYIHVKASIDGYYSYPKMPKVDMISINEIKNMMDIFEVGSHTINHPDLSKASFEEIIFELRESKKFLEKKLNVEVRHFCYPFGKVFEGYSSLLKQEGYLTATTLKNDLIEQDGKLDIFLLPRIEWKEISSMSFKDFLKNLDFYVKIFFGI